ncbi:MAG: hypothetical protein ORN57_02160 [Alphaproteobacteria bacterium]|nr:hypothetical protein [Alphaproteobacteria bacterium]
MAAVTNIVGTNHAIGVVPLPPPLVLYRAIRPFHCPLVSQNIIPLTCLHKDGLLFCYQPWGRGLMVPPFQQWLTPSVIPWP